MDAGEAFASAGGKDVLSGDEIKEALDALTAADMLRLSRAEDHFRHGTDFARGDLLHGAFCQAILGERRCPRGVSVVRFLAGAMRSASGHRRDELRRQVALDAPTAGREGKAAKAPADWLSWDGLDPEAHLLESERTNAVDAMMSVFTDDEEAQLVILGAADGLRGEALCAQTALTSNRLHYVLRKMRKRLGEDRDGWMP